MPLPTDEKLLALAQNVLQQFDTIFGLHPGFRPAHAKGTMLTGTFTPSPQAASLTRRTYQRASTPVTVRFSDSTGIPVLPDNDPHADPRGMAIRFHLAEHSHTDIVAHSTDGFPARTGEEFFEFLHALATSDLSKPSDPANPKPIEKFLGTHPAALAFVQPNPALPASHARPISPSRLTISPTATETPDSVATESCRSRATTISARRLPQPNPPTIYSMSSRNASPEARSSFGWSCN